MMPMLLLFCWLAAAAGYVLWLLLRVPEPAQDAPPPPDPWVHKVAEFRRQLHDWDRAGRPGAGDG